MNDGSGLIIYYLHLLLELPVMRSLVRTPCQARWSDRSASWAGCAARHTLQIDKQQHTICIRLCTYNQQVYSVETNLCANWLRTNIWQNTLHWNCCTDWHESYSLLALTWALDRDSATPSKGEAFTCSFSLILAQSLSTSQFVFK